MNLLETESYSDVLSNGRRRKRPKLTNGVNDLSTLLASAEVHAWAQRYQQQHQTISRPGLTKSQTSVLPVFYTSILCECPGYTGDNTWPYFTFPTSRRFLSCLVSPPHMIYVLSVCVCTCAGQLHRPLCVCVCVCDMCPDGT